MMGRKKAVTVLEYWLSVRLVSIVIDDDVIIAYCWH